MSKENVKKFYEMVNGSEELQKELRKRDSEYAKTHDAPAEGASEDELAAAKKAAFEGIIVPVAKEHGLVFTVDEVIEYEKEKFDEMDRELDNSELRDAAGGDGVNTGFLACLFAGVGFGMANVTGTSAQNGGCFGIGWAVALHWEICVFWA